MLTNSSDEAVRQAAREATLVQWLREARQVLVFCGAGVSVESGVPTFRGAGGLWEGQRVEDVATPEAFEYNPQKVWRFYAQRQAGLITVAPNPAHTVLAAMERHYPGFLLVTQNVDNLHERAGSEKLIKFHGSLMETRCTECRRVTPIGEPVPLAEIEADRLPHCRCGGLLRPNVVWFGEALLRRHLTEMQEFLAGMQGGGQSLLLVIGTSGAVSDGYGIVKDATRRGARTVEINPDPTHLTRQFDLILRERAGVLLERVWREVDPKP